METKIASRKARVRLEAGAAISANAQSINTKPVKGRLEAFSALHRSYAEAQRKVDEVETALATTMAQAARLDADQDHAVEALALCLANEGEPRTKPFSRFGSLGPGRLKNLPFADEVKAIHTLVETLQRNQSLSQATRAAAQMAEQAAQKLEAALPGLEMLRNDLKSARSFRDTIARNWQANLSALRLAARAAAATEVPGLDTALFGRRSRTAAKPAGARDKPVSTSSPAQPTQPTSANAA